ncbi:SHOCT domain-containing protein [Streptomyces sp. NPDC097619]|uniref:SHOCT domain-containing protein n=1 Tax=Streptomyces sp. NPDC097619 TaxID=3157228 RepID=UPI0033303EEA
MDDYPLLNLFWTMLWIFLWVMWFFLLFRVITDLFRDHEMGGWAKAGWLVLVLLLPYLGVLVYLIVRGRSMAERDRKQMADQEKAFKDYVREAAGTPGAAPSKVDELHKLSDLKDKGALTQEEFDRAKEKLLA